MKTSEDLDALADSLLFEYIGRASATASHRNVDNVVAELQAQLGIAEHRRKQALDQLILAEANSEASMNQMLAELATTQQVLASNRAELIATQAELASSKAQLTVLRNSTSWKVGYAASRPIHVLRLLLSRRRSR